MRVFEKSAKINFVDENNVLVGYDANQKCCEYAGWAIFESIPTEDKVNSLALPEEPEDLTGVQLKLKPYVFDVSSAPIKVSRESIEDANKEDNCIFFRLVAANAPDLYLCLFNCHTGYYERNFEMQAPGMIPRLSSL